jgi:tetratricopeptide (TPR) repeat protein
LYEESEQLARRPTHNLKAYESYLRARHLMARRTSTAIEAAIGHFQRAVELDPEFALAHVGLAEAHLLHGDYGTASYEESVPVIERSIYRALEIDGRLGEAFTSLAALREMQARLVEADSLYQRGVELAPSYATGYHWYGTALGNSRSEADKAEAMLRKAVELDPLSPVINAAHAQQLRRMGHFAEALAGLERVVELDEDFPGAYLGIADIYYREYGRIDEALEKLDRAIALDAGNLTLRYTRASFLAGAGRIDEAIAECRAAIGASPDWATGYMMAGDIYHKLGQIEGALACYREVAVSDREDYWGEANWAGVLLEMGDERTAEALIERLPPVQSSMLDMGLQLCRLDVDGAKRAVDRLASLAGLPYFDAEIAEVALLEGRHADVLEMYRRVAPDLVGNHDARIHSNNLDPAILIAAAQIGLGETESARWLLSKCAAYLESLPETMRRYEYGRQLAEVYALQGRRREALDALASGVDQGLRNGWCITMCSPMLASIRDEPEFTAIFEEIRVDLAAMRARLPAAQRTLP